MAARNTAGLVAAAILLAAQAAFSGHLVEYLPGYQGKLPFKLETGYVSVGEIEMFYYFIESQGDPNKDPLFLWLTGGPGCSSISGMLYEIGPLELNLTSYDGDSVTFNYFAETWTKSASIIFLDSPVGTGFSYSTTLDGWASSDTKAAKQVYQFLLKWLEENPKYMSLETYIGGDSYGGMIVPQVTKLVVEGVRYIGNYPTKFTKMANEIAGLEAQIQPRVNLKGYLLGSPVTDKTLQTNFQFIFRHRMGLISDDLYKTAKESCNGNYAAADVDPSNTKCVLALEEYQKCIKDLDQASTLDPKCTIARPHETLNRRSLEEHSSKEFWCRYFQYVPVYTWANDPQVKEALHVRKDTVSEWLRCTHKINYTYNVESVVPIHRYLATKRLNVLVMNGDRDNSVPNMATESWIKSLNLTVDETWRPWFVDGQVAGYTEKYYKTEDGYHLVYATVKGAGHIVQLYYRKRSFYMFDRWVHKYPL